MNIRLKHLEFWKITLALRMWWLALRVKLALLRRPLPTVVDDLVRPPRRLQQDRIDPRQLGAINDRVLRLGAFRPRCLICALVHLRLLRAQGDAAILVIGLPRDKASTDAHAWVELDGVVVGPPPGRKGHQAFVRYPLARPVSPGSDS